MKYLNSVTLLFVFVILSPFPLNAEETRNTEDQRTIYLSCNGTLQTAPNRGFDDSTSKPSTKGFLIRGDEPFVKSLTSEELTFGGADCRMSEFSYSCGTNYNVGSISVNNTITFYRATGTVSQMIYSESTDGSNPNSYPSRIYKGKCEISETPKF